MINYATLIDLFPLLASLFLLTVFFTFLLIKTPLRYGIKLFGIPAILLLSVISFTTMTDMLGRPYKALPPDGFVLISYKIHTIESNKKVVLQAWVYEPGGTRLYQFPYTEQRKEELDAALALQKDTGGWIVGSWKEEPDVSNSDRWSRGILILNPWQPSQAAPKD